MPVIENFHPALSIDELLRFQGRAAERPEIKGLAQWAIDEAQQLATPAVVYEWFPVHVVENGTVQIGDAVFNIGLHADLLAFACEALVHVCTIGKALEERVQTLLADNRLLESHLLDTAGIIALGTVGEPIRRIVEEEAARRGWGVSCAMGPGSLAGWTISDQKALCSLVDLTAIGVAITVSGILKPQMSGSGLIGIGPDYKAHCVSSTCQFCRFQNTCQFRH